MQEKRSAARVFESQAERMETHASEWIDSAAISAIPDDRVSKFGQVRPYLILPPCFQLNLQYGQVGEASQNTEVGDGMLSNGLVFCRAHPGHPIFGKPAPNGSSVFRHSTFDDSPVFPLDFMLTKQILQLSLDLLGFREYQEPTDEFVQPVNDKELLVSVPHSQVLAQVRIGGSLALVVRCNGQEAGRLMNYQQVIIFEDDRQATELARKRALPRYFQNIARLNLLVGDLNRRAI